MSLASIDVCSANSDYLFKPVVKIKSGYKLIQKVKPLSYTRARESILGLLRSLYQKQLILAYIHLGCWKRHGRWRSESAKDGYAEDSIENRLLLSKSLGIGLFHICIPVLCFLIQCSSSLFTSVMLCNCFL